MEDVEACLLPQSSYNNDPPDSSVCLEGHSVVGFSDTDKGHGARKEEECQGSSGGVTVQSHAYVYCTKGFMKFFNF